MYDVKIEKTGTNNEMSVKFMFNTHEDINVECAIRHLTDGRCLKGRTEKRIHDIMNVALCGNIPKAEEMYSSLVREFISIERELRNPKKVERGNKKIIFVPA